MAKQHEQTAGSSDTIDMVDDPSLEKSTGSDADDKVKLETKIIIKSVPWAKSCNDFPVLVRVTAPQPGNETSSAGVDIVVVLDTSEGMSVENRLDNVKQTMKQLIQQLDPHDRLSLVSFNGKVQRLMELSEMSDENREKARAEVDKLKARGGNDVGAAMKEAALILGQREEKEKSSRDGRVIVLSDDSEDKATPTENDDDPKVMRHYIADKTLGAISHATNSDTDKINDALEQSIRGGAPLVATGLQINLQTHEGVAISSIESGSHCASFSPQVRSSMIQVQELRAGEQKNFVVYLTVPEGKEQLMNVYGAYRSPKPISEKEASVQLDHSEIAIPRPKESTPSDGETTIYPEEGAEFIWLRLSDVGTATVEHHGDDRLHKLWEVLKAKKKVEPGKNIPVQEKVKIMWDKCINWATCNPYICMLPTHASSMKKVMERMTYKQVHNNSQLEQQAGTQKKTESDQGKVKYTTNWAGSKSYATRALPCVVAVVLLMALLYLMLNGSGDTTSQGSNNNITLLDISQHPGLPEIEKSLEETMLQAMEDVGITSILNDQSIESMSHAMNRYLYLGLVHTLGGRCMSNFVETENVSLLEQKIARLEVEKKDLRGKMEALAKEKENKEEVFISNCKEKHEALERVNTRIAELERQLQDKKVFADSLLLEIANADAHLKTCNQKADMLEGIFREVEVVNELN